MKQIKTYRPLFFLSLFIFILGLHTSAQKPTISSFSPAKGSIGTSVTISGNNFSTVASSNIVYFGDAKAVVSNATAATLTVIVPPGTSYKPISVTVNGLTAYSLLPFTVTFPSDGVAYSSHSFSPKVDSSWGFGVTTIGATDLDGDGDVDPVLVSASSNFISILKNNSDIGAVSLLYSTSSKYSTGTSPVYVSFGDFDGDAKQDIVVANKKTNTLSVFRNNSSTDSILLIPKIDLATDSLPSVIVVSDIDSDGKPDIICTNYGSNTISVFRNTTAGGILSFASKINYVTGKSPYGLVFADMDGDGVQELVVANENDLTISIFKNSSTAGTISLGNKKDISTGYVSMLAASDFDGDGKIDLASTTNLSSFLVVLKNTGSPGDYSFAASQQFITGFGTPFFFAVSDIDGDGKPDLAVNHNYYSTISILKNLSQPGTIAFSSNVDFYVGQMPSSILLTDLDNDARPDIITTGSGSSAISILKNVYPKPFIASISPATAGNGSVVTITGNNFLTTSQVSFGNTPASSFMVQSSSVITAVVDTGSTGSVSVTTAYGVASYSGFSFTKLPTISSFTPTKGGVGTVITINGANFSNVTSVNIGNVAATSFTIVSPTTITATIGPLNDGNYDVSVTNASGTATRGSFYAGVTVGSFYPTSGPVGTTVTINGTHFSSVASDNIVYFGPVRASVISATPTSLLVVVPAGASYQPISITVNHFTAYSLQPFIVTFKGTGNEFTSSSFGDRVDSAAGNYPIYISITDLNSDSKPDAITSNFASGSISVSKNTGSNGKTSFQYKTDYATTKPTVWSTSTGDLDGDGKNDVIVATSDNGVSLDRSFSVFRNTSSTDSIMLGRIDFPIGIMNNNPRYSVVADFDGDGKPDIVFSGGAILRNITTSGTINFIFQPINLTTDSPIATADVDGDGKLDIIVVSSQEIVYVIRNTSEPGQVSFAPAKSFPTGFSPRDVVVGDFDNDGKPDMAVLNAGNNSLSIYKNKSTAGVVAFDDRITYQLNVIPDNLSLGDLDGDGRLDIAFVTGRDYFVYLLKNTSSANNISFADKVAYDAPYRPDHVFIADMNSDGKADIIVSNEANANNFSVLVNKCQDDGLPTATITTLGPTELCEGGNVILKTTSVDSASYQWYKDGNLLASATDSVYTANSSGLYSVRIISGSNVSSSAPLAIRTKSNPPDPVLTVSGTGNVCNGSSTVLHSSTQFGIQWYKNNTLINGVTDSVYRVDTTGKYKVIAISNGCLSLFSNEITITKNSLPVPSITAAATSFCAGDSTSLSANSVNGYLYQWNINEDQLPGATSPTITTKNGGSFSVTETDNKGCSAKSQAITITKSPAPLKPTITQTGNDLKSSVQNGNQWFKDGVAIAGAVSQTLSASANGNYSVQATQNGCKSAMSDTYAFILTSIVNIDNSHFIKLDPNPVHNGMIIEFNLNGIYQLNIELLDLNGRVIKRWSGQKTGNTLYLSGFPNSIYIAKIYSNNGRINKCLKLIKE